MQLIGMLDSPYVRRTAISLRLLGIAFEHRAVSVFSTFEAFQAINPVVKAPSLVCADGTVLMDSTLIIDYAETLALPGRSLMPASPGERQQALHLLGLALAACEKGVQIIYEQNLRPAEKQHGPWLGRVQGQLLAATTALERALAGNPLPVEENRIMQPAITLAVMWRFLQMMVPDIVLAAKHPALTALSARAEALPVFIAFPPVGPGVQATP